MSAGGAPPDADVTARRRSMLREGGALLAHGVLYGFGFLRSRHRPLRDRDIRTVVLVHGFGGSRASFFPLQAWLALQGHRRQYSYNYRSSGSVEGLAVELKRRLSEQVKGGRIDLVCHSLGGLVARFYLQALGGARRVARLITLAPPHPGTWSSAYVPTTQASPMRPGSPFLERLDALPPPEGVACTSFVAGRDLVVLPPDSARAPFGESRTFPELGHNDILLAPGVYTAVRDLLAGDPA